MSKLGPPEDAMQLTLKMQEEVKECNAKNTKNVTLTAGEGKEMDSTSGTSSQYLDFSPVTHLRLPASITVRDYISVLSH